MEFNRLLSSVISEYGEPSFSDKNFKSENTIVQKKISKDQYSLIKNEEEIDELITQAHEIGEIAIDTETSSLNLNEAELVGISICSKIGRAFYIPIGHKTGKCLKKDLVIKKLKPILEDQSVKKIGQNIKFDFIILFKNGITMNAMEDTMLMSYVLDAGKNRHNMDTLSEIHLNHKTISFKEIVGIGKKTN